jgi:N-terminal domain of toast_rack, DUF2154
MIRKLLPVVLVLALSSIACGFNVSVPIHTVTPGPLVTDPIHVTAPDSANPVDLSLAFGAGTLKIQPGSNNALVSGTASYNIADFKPAVTVNGSNIRVEQGNWHLTGIPDLSNIKNSWDLSLGEQPLNLSIEAGAYHADYQFGGLALANLTVKDGASDAKMNFASPNLTEMSLLSYETGASNVSLTGLGYANFASLLFHSGAGNFTLDFAGGLKRDGSVNIETGVSNTTLVIPSGMPVQLTVDGGLSNVTYDSGWTKNANLYTQNGSGPQLTIVVHMGAGNLTITR